MSDTPLTTIGDEAIEARIVAWVLGEASAFETAELERLCVERPELAIFHRRMRALHGLIGEAETSQPDEAWKLPAAKRAVVLNHIDRHVPHAAPWKEARARRSAMRSILSIAACVIFVVIILGLASPMFIRQRKKSDVASARSMAMQRELAALEEQMEAESMMTLLTDFPPERIEGTPRPMVLPKRTPNARPVGGGFRQIEDSPSPAASQPAATETSTASDAFAMADVSEETNTEREPSASSSAMSKVIAGAPDDILIPVPEVARNEPSLDFGDVDHFGKGWGHAGGGAGGTYWRESEGRRHADETVTPGAIDGLLAGAQREQEEALKNDISGHKSKDANSQDAPAVPYGYDSRGEENSRSLVQREMIPRQVPTGEVREKHGKQEELQLEAVLKPATPEEKPDPASFIEETSAAEEPYSTFSLNISDASFRIAQAALAKGERPDPAGIKVEQFYNAVDYGDPAPAAGEPVACAIEQAAHPVIPGRNLVRVSLKTAAAGRSAAQPLRLTLLVDQSGSMSRTDRREAMDKALSSLGGLLTAHDKVSVIGFARTSRLLADGLTGDQAAARLADVANPAASEGGTNLETAIDLAGQLAKRHHTQGAQNRIVLFTDGAANLGDADPLRLAAKVEQLRQQGVAFDIAGIAADDLNDNLLGELARKGNGRYSVVGKGEKENFAKQLAGAFRPAAENVKVQVRFNPERVSRYKLIGFEKDRLKTEDFRNDAVDAAELAAEEAGVAVYQVETIPDGRGEIGEVSVRFRDTARGEMVERRWTMPHTPSAPAIDQAAPSMQLATLALLAGEKLKGGPLAEAIDFKQLAEPQATVKQAFGRDTRVAEMLQMVESLK